MPNRLAREASPYLLQHADNPVDWWPWCDEALELARRDDKPILLSVGYSACHWCHVMAHESFEDPDTAATMNRLFVNIKVDREERPDLDQIYQRAQQLLTGRGGGWPLTMFLTPDGEPFYGGTYFPPNPRYGLPGFGDLLERVAEAWRERRDAIDEQNGALRAALARTDAAGAPIHPADIDAVPAARLRDLLEQAYDGRHGGFGEPPKFPHGPDLEFLLRRARVAGDGAARDMALATLARMAEGGIADQLGGGFFRYSVDARWQIPHFEKMLYDNGVLLGLYAHAWQASGESLFRQAAEGIAGWVMREMQDPAGGYRAALDADSEGEEGKFYVWDRTEVQARLAAPDYAVAAPHYGLDGAPNFENRHWHLAVARPLEAIARDLDIPLDEAADRLARARAALFAERSHRVRPGVDDKLLTGWNALMIGGMARAARVFGRDDWLASARRAMEFVRGGLWRGGRLYAASDGKSPRLNAYLDDHAFLMDALLELMQAEFDPRDLEFAEDLADALLDDFEDRAAGGFFFTRHDHEGLIHRPKPFHDQATPAGNGVAARALGRLGHLTGETRYLDAAQRTVGAFHAALARDPSGGASLVLALEELLVPPAVVVLRGAAEGLRTWQTELAAHYLPDVLVLALPPEIGPLPPLLDKPIGPEVNAWVCRGVECLSPVKTSSELVKLLGNSVLHR